MEDWEPLRYFKGKVDVVLELKGTRNTAQIRFLEDGEGYKRGDRITTSIRNCWRIPKR